METKVEQAREPEEIDLLDVLRVVVRGKWIVLITAVVFTLGAAAYAFYVPRTYTATATVLPESVGSSGSSSLSQLAGLASLAGISVPTGSSGGSGPMKSMSAILASRLYSVRVVTDAKVVEVLAPSKPGEAHPAGYDPTIEAGNVFHTMLKTKTEGSTGVLSLSVESKDPELAMNLANKSADVLDALMVEKAKDERQKADELLQRQIHEQELKVNKLQEDLAMFQRSTSLLDPKSQASSSIDAYTRLIQQKMALQVQMATYSDTLSATNPKYVALERQIQSLDDQISQVKNQVDGDLPSLKAAPENFIRYQNITRDLEIATRIYAGLLGSNEQSKLNRGQEDLYIEMLDPALLPTESKPNRVQIVAIGAAGGLFLGVFLVFGWVGLTPLRQRWNSTSVQPSGTQVPFPEHETAEAGRRAPNVN